MLQRARALLPTFCCHFTAGGDGGELITRAEARRQPQQRPLQPPPPLSDRRNTPRAPRSSGKPSPGRHRQPHFPEGSGVRDSRPFRQKNKIKLKNKEGKYAPPGAGLAPSPAGPPAAARRAPLPSQPPGREPAAAAAAATPSGSSSSKGRSPPPPTFPPRHRAGRQHGPPAPRKRREGSGVGGGQVRGGRGASVAVRRRSASRGRERDADPAGGGGHGGLTPSEAGPRLPAEERALKPLPAPGAAGSRARPAAPGRAAVPRSPLPPAEAMPAVAGCQPAGAAAPPPPGPGWFLAALRRPFRAAPAQGGLCPERGGRAGGRRSQTRAPRRGKSVRPSVRPPRGKHRAGRFSAAS